MSNIHKVFVSYHHANDQCYRDKFEKICSNVLVSKSVQIDDIKTNLQTETIHQKIRDEYLKDSTVTVVLIGQDTWKRKHVDWEIASSIRDTEYNPRSGLIGILLPSYRSPDYVCNYTNSTIPPRLYYNINCNFAKIYSWSDNPNNVQSWIHKAFLRRETIPDNSYETFVNNRSGDRWY